MKDYFVYLPEAKTAVAWEGVATSAGYCRVRPASEYPPYRHPVDHHFDWANGRVLGAYQIVFVTEGSGTFETRPPEASYGVSPGTVLLLFPGVWHRYAPKPATGWTEHWLEVRGAAFDRLVMNGLFSPAEPVLHPGLHPDLLQCFERVHAWAQRVSPGRQTVLATLGLHLLSLIREGAAGHGRTPSPLDQTVLQAQALLAERYHESLNMQDIARTLGMGYSHFRQLFRERVGMSPKHYHLRLRLQKAEDLLINTNKSVKEISEILAFNTPYHLSAQFKEHTGLAPAVWRERRASGLIKAGQP